MSKYYFNQIGTSFNNPNVGGGVIYYGTATAARPNNIITSTGRYDIGYKLRATITNPDYVYTSVTWKDPVKGDPWVISADGKEATSTIRGVIVDSYGDSIIVNAKMGTVIPPNPTPEMKVTQADIDSYVNGVLYVQGEPPATVGKKYVKNYTIEYITNLKDWIVDGITLNNGNLPFIRVDSTNNFRLQYPYDYNTSGLTATVNGRFKVYTINQLDIDAVNAGNSKLYVNGVLATNGTVIKIDDIVKVVANSGYQFYLDTKGRSSVYASGVSNGFPLSENNTVATYTLKSVADRLYFTVSTIEIVPETIAGVNRIYKVDAEKVKTIISRKWIDDSAPLNPVEVGGQIISVLEIPFKIPSNLVGNASNIFLGAYDTGISATTLKDDELVVDLGNIKVTSVKNNFLDYENTTAILNLPYVEPLFLEIEKIIDKIVNVKYIVNLYNSMTTINVYSDGRLLVTKTIDLNLQVPFGDVQKIPKGSNSNDISMVKNNGIRKAYIEVIRNDTVLENGFFTIPIVDETLLIGQNGFVKIDEINLKVKASKDEKEMILNAINQGVIIK